MSVKRVGVLLALVIGFLMIFFPGEVDGKLRFSNLDLADMIKSHNTAIEPETVSQWIVEERQDFILIDIRTSGEFSNYHLPDALHIPLEELLTSQSAQTLPPGKYVILYGNGSVHASQAALVLQSMGMPVLFMEGGLNGWAQRVLNPTPPDWTSNEEVLKYKLQKAIGDRLQGGAPAEAEIQAPAVKKRRLRAPGSGRKGGGC